MGAMTIKSRSRPHRTTAEKADLVAAFHRSGLGQRDFAIRQGIAPSNLQRWVQRSHLAAKPQGLAALVEVPNLLAAGSGRYRLHFPKGLMLELTSGFDPGEVRRLAELVQSL
jgi:hypothetical protein